MILDLGSECLLTEIVSSAKYFHSSATGELMVFGSNRLFSFEIFRDFRRLSNSSSSQSRLQTPSDSHSETDPISDTPSLMLQSKIISSVKSKEPTVEVSVLCGRSVRYLYVTLQASTYVSGNAKFTLSILGHQPPQVPCALNHLSAFFSSVSHLLPQGSSWLQFLSSSEKEVESLHRAYFKVFPFFRFVSFPWNS
jgi:hypothetical protein